MINSAIYNGQVIHKRFKPKVHYFKYKVFSLLIDLSELETLDKKVRFTHPYYDQKALDTQQELSKLQNQKHLLFCGSYFGYGFHEDGIKSSIEMLKNLND